MKSPRLVKMRTANVVAGTLVMLLVVVASYVAAACDSKCRERVNVVYQDAALKDHCMWYTPATCRVCEAANGSCVINAADPNPDGTCTQAFYFDKDGVQHNVAQFGLDLTTDDGGKCEYACTVVAPKFSEAKNVTYTNDPNPLKKLQDKDNKTCPPKS
jgi:hypothetical protein